tara:strand:+ start:450 stop:872 length:423 start_codon:yes stop_codon:yes gene_type:complete
MTLGLANWPKAVWRGGWEVKQGDDKERPIEVIVPDVPYEGARLAKKLTTDMAVDLADQLRSNVLDEEEAHKSFNQVDFTTFDGSLVRVKAKDVRHISRNGEKAMFPLVEGEKKSFITLEVTSTEATRVMESMWRDKGEKG